MQQNLKLLPKRPRSVQEKAFPYKVRLMTNFNHIQLRKQPDIYQFYIDTEPIIPDDSIEVLRDLVRSLKQPLIKAFRLMCHKGKILWGLQPLEKPLILCAKLKEQTFEVLIKQTKVLREGQISNLTGKALRQVLSVYSVALKESIISMGMIEVTRGRYIRIKARNQEQHIIQDAGLHLIRTYTFKLTPLSQGIKLLVDVGTRALRMQNFLETLSKSKTIDEKMSYIDSIVQCRYGNRCSYKITNINFSLSPLSTFCQQKNQSIISYLDYYAIKYKIKIRQVKQPLVEVIQRIEQKIVDGKIVKKEIKVYLIPELIRLVGVPEFNKKDQYRIMQQFAQFSKMQPSQREQFSRNVIDQFNQQKGDLQIGGPIEVDGFILPQTTYFTSFQRQSENGLINIRQKLKDPMRLQKLGWMCVYYQSTQYDDEEADDLISSFQKAQGMFGINIMDPDFVIVKKDHPEEWKAAVRNSFDPKQHKLIILLFSNRQARYYGQLKTFLINQLKVGSQVILKKTIKSKGIMTISSKIICQMNAKLGKALWEVVPKHKFWAGKTLAYGGLSISGSKKIGNSLSFVGTFSKDLTKYFCSNKNNLPTRQQIDQKIYEDIFVDWIKKYTEFTKSVPDVIIIYREGLSEQQIKIQGEKQLSALFKVIARANKKYIGYRPQIVYIVANKRISTKFYSRETYNRSPGKFMPKLLNPQPGTVIFEPLSSDKAYDFHLAAQRVIQGTCTPTHYRIAYDDSHVPQQAIAQFTYEQCYNYYNWMGAIRVPSCLQMADKLSKFMGQHMKQPLASSQLLKTPFYL